MNMEKQPLTDKPPSPPQPHPLLLSPYSAAESRRTTKFYLFKSLLILVALLLALLQALHFVFPYRHSLLGFPVSLDAGASRCEQYPARKPSADAKLDDNKAKIFGDEYRKESAEILGGIVRVRSETFDNMGPDGVDPRWDVFYNIEKYLESAFPLIHSSPQVVLKKLNTHALLYTWQGSDPDLKPTVLMAHLDTVPVPDSTLDYWTHPPFSGHYDGTYLWGRGSVDTKNTVSGTLEAATLLLKAGFVPRRTVLLAFGFDEESRSTGGAGKIAEYLTGIYGEGGIAFVVDEGGLGIGPSKEFGGGAFALPATAEKGSINVNFTLHTPGGHSSTPPPHTGIGILASVITTLESTPFQPSLSTSSPIFNLLQCASEHGSVSPSLKTGINLASRPGKTGERAREKVANEYAKLGRTQRYVVSTSQAVDLIHGGVKVNALPEVASVVANYRINVDSSPDFIRETIKNLVLPLAKRHGLDLDAFGVKHAFVPSAGDDADLPGGELTLSAPWGSVPSPISPTASAPWELLASTLRHSYLDRYGDGLVVAPSVMTGGTDTRWYWNLTRHIYRFTPTDRSRVFGQHTVDEHLLFDDHISGIWFFHELIRNADSASL